MRMEGKTDRHTWNEIKITKKAGRNDHHDDDDDDDSGYENRIVIRIWRRKNRIPPLYI